MLVMFYPVMASHYSSQVQQELEKYNYEALFMIEIEFTTKQVFQKSLLELEEEVQKRPQSSYGVLISFDTIKSEYVSWMSQLAQKVDIIFAKGGTNSSNRFILEQTCADVLLDPQSSRIYKKQDFIHHFNSGLNHVLVQIAKERGKLLASTLHFFSQKYYFKEVGRIEQNIFLARKKNLPFYLGYLARDKFDIKSLHSLTSIYGLFSYSTEQLHASLASLDKVIELNRKKKAGIYLKEGLYLLEE